jgi:DNA-binding MarR family transcriptional regulator
MKKQNNYISNISDDFFELLAKLQFFEREYLRKCGIDDVTTNEVKVLYIIGLSNTKSMSEIAEELKVTRGTLSITVDTLVKKGYVIRNRHKQDRRVIILYLTKKAISVVRQYSRFYESLFQELVQNLNDKKVNFLKEILRRLNDIIETDFYEIDQTEEFSDFEEDFYE